VQEQDILEREAVVLFAVALLDLVEDHNAVIHVLDELFVDAAFIY
jgi:hypothetical protein